MSKHLRWDKAKVKSKGWNRYRGRISRKEQWLRGRMEAGKAFKANLEESLKGRTVEDAYWLGYWAGRAAGWEKGIAFERKSLKEEMLMTR